MASPSKVTSNEEWSSLLTNCVTGNSLEDIFMFLLHYQSQVLKNQEFAVLLLAVLEDLDSLSHTETMILRDLQIFAKIQKKANGSPAKKNASTTDFVPGWDIQKVSIRKKHMCPCDNKCSLGDSCLLRTAAKLLCDVKFWATKNDNLTVDSLCYDYYVTPLWENSRKFFHMLDGDLHSRSFFIRFTESKGNFFKCCDLSCTASLGEPINISSLAFLDGKVHCFCDNCFDFSSNDVKCPNCEFFLSDSYNRLTLALST